MNKCQICEHEFKPKPEQTAGEKWAGERPCCPLSMAIECKELNECNGACTRCRAKAAKAYDIGQAALTLMTAEECARSEDRLRWGSVMEATCLGQTLGEFEIVRKRILDDFIKLNRELILKGPNGGAL